MHFFSFIKRFNVASILALFLCIAAMPVLTACGDDDDEPTMPIVPGASVELTANLVGTWVANHSDYQSVAVFNADGTGMVYDTDYPEDYALFVSFQVINNHLMVLWQGDSDWDDQGEIVFVNANTFILDGDTFVKVG